MLCYDALFVSRFKVVRSSLSGDACRFSFLGHDLPELTRAKFGIVKRCNGPKIEIVKYSPYWIWQSHSDRPSFLGVNILIYKLVGFVYVAVSTAVCF